MATRNNRRTVVACPPGAAFGIAVRLQAAFKVQGRYPHRHDPRLDSLPMIAAHPMLMAQDRAAWVAESGGAKAGSVGKIGGRP